MVPSSQSTKEGKIAVGTTSYIDTWKAMEKLVAKGRSKAIGISNFDQSQIQDILDQCDIVSSHTASTARHD